MGARGLLWTDMVAAGETAEPASGRDGDGLAGRMAGAVALGEPRPAGGRHLLPVAAFDATGSTLTYMALAFDTPEAARALGLRLRLRAGPKRAEMGGAEGEAALLVQAMAEGIAIRHVEESDGAAVALLRAYAAGGRLDLDGLPLRPGHRASATCSEGGAWFQIAGLAGAQRIARAGLPEAAARYVLDLVRGGDEATDARHHVLAFAEAPGLSAWVRVPGPEADPFELPEVTGPGGADPFPEHAGRIADLGRAIDAMLGPRHCLRAPASVRRRHGPA